ncbi:MAG: hypothetical protein QG580_322 [Patescibacteria group bacterium]|jgi:fumarate reductase subunit C|nr:hypothetical protein [Patescibacteria group bacterium]
MTLKEMIETQTRKMSSISYGTFALLAVKTLLKEGLAKSIASIFLGLSLITLIAFPIGYSKSTLKNPMVVFWNIVIIFLCLINGAEFSQAAEKITGNRDVAVSVLILSAIGGFLFTCVVIGLGIRARKKDEE